MPESTSRNIKIIVLIISMFLFTSITLANIPIGYWKEASHYITVESKDTCLSVNDEIKIVINDSLNYSKLKAIINPSKYFKIYNMSSSGEKAIIKAKVRDQTKEAKELEGNIIITDDVTVINETFYFSLGCTIMPILKSEAIEIFFINKTYVKIWHWFIKAPHKLKYKIFIAPHIRNFNLMKDYLELQVFIKLVTPRDNVWWPLRNYGTYIVDKNISDLIIVKDVLRYYLVNVTEWPEYANGVTIAYSGIVTPCYGESFITYNLTFGFTSPSVIYVVTPSSWRVKAILLNNEPMNMEKCIYAPKNFSCHLVRINKAILNSYVISIVLFTS